MTTVAPFAHHLRRQVPFLFLLTALAAQAPVVRPLRAWKDGLLAPVRVARDSRGRVYCSDARLGTVSVRDEYGRLIATQGGFDRPLGIAVDAQDRVFVAEEGSGSVAIFGTDWARLGQLGQGAGEFLQPNHLAAAADGSGEIYVTDSGANAVKVYGADGAKHRTFGGRGALAGQFDFPAGIAVSGKGEVFVADQNNDRVQVLDRTGTWLRSLGASGMLGSRFGRVQGLLLDASNRLYVADAFKGIVHVLDPATGVFLGTVGSFGDGPGQLLGPSSLALDRNNRLFVASAGSGRVDVFGLDYFTDPSVLQAIARISPPALVRVRDRRTRRGENPYLAVAVAIPGVPADQIVPASLTLNGQPAMDPPGTALKDFDPGGTTMLVAAFALQPLLDSLPDGQVALTVRGWLPGGQPFEATVLAMVQATGDPE